MSKKPDNVADSPGLLPYGSNVGAPAIKQEDISLWKTEGVVKTNNYFKSRYEEIKEEYRKLIEEFEWNEMIYNSKFSFEPVIGEIYHLYVGNEGSHFLSLIPPNEWNKEHIGTFKLNSDKKWVKQL